MATRARRTITLTVLLATSVLMVLSGAPAAYADLNDPAPPTPPNVKASGPVITVTVTGSGYRRQKSGPPGTGSGGSVSVFVPAPCWMSPWATGKEYYVYVASGKMALDNRHFGEDMTALPGYEAYKDDDLGHWYGSECSSANWPDPNDVTGFLKFTDEYFPAHRPVYVPANQTPPTPPVPPVLLREVAIKSLTLPDPKLDWNPKRIGNQGTLVNLDTWFWLDNAPTSLDVRASAGGNEASVTATFNGMDISAPGEAPLHCVGPGTPYSSGAQATACSLPFSRASSAIGAQTTPVTVKTKWTGTWAANGVDQGAITPQPAPVTATANVRVDEVQTLVTGAR